MKLPANPTNPYIRQRPQTLGDARNCLHGTGPAAALAGGRSRAISSRSAALSCDISAGRLRNQSQNSAAQTRPASAMSVMVVDQSPCSLVERLSGIRCNSLTPAGGPPKTLVMSQTTKMGAAAPPTRLKVQIEPWAKPRLLAGIQSATTRANPGKTPA